MFDDMLKVGKDVAAEVMQALGPAICDRLESTAKLNAALLMAALHPTITPDNITEKIRGEMSLVCSALYGVALGAYHMGTRDQSEANPNADTSVRIAAQAMLEALDGRTCEPGALAGAISALKATLHN